MRKIKNLIITIIMICFLLPLNVFAVGSVSVSNTNLNITKGSSKTFTITANNAAGRIDISSSNSGVASVSTSSVFLDMQSNTITVHGRATGTATITVRAVDVTTYDDEDLSGKTYTINVKVSEPVKEPNKAPATNSNNNTANNNANNNLSKNNNIKNLTVEGYELVKVDNNNYTLEVSNNVTSIDIKATTEDSKAKITGTGSHELKIGENKIEVIVTSESGAQNKINIKVTRKDGYYLEDLESLLNDSTIEDINIIIKSDSKLTKDYLTKIKKSEKTINLNYFDENKKMLYSWTLDGTKIKDYDEFLTSISYISEYVKEIQKLSNYADGLYINFKHNGNLPKGTKIKLYVGDKFSDGNIVKVYHYNKEENTLDFIKDNLEVKEGYIEFSIEHCSEYFVTMSNINTIIDEDVTSSINIFMIISIIELLIIIVLVILMLKKKHNKKENYNDIDLINTNNISNSTNNINTQTNTLPNNAINTNLSNNVVNTTNNQSQIMSNTNINNSNSNINNNANIINNTTPNNAINTNNNVNNSNVFNNNNNINSTNTNVNKNTNIFN